MKTLIINTSNKILDIVLSIDAQVFSISSNQDAKHNEVLITLIDNLLTQHNLNISDIDKFGVVVGPGSFTGIRVGVATIKAFRDVTKSPAYGINNLDLLYALAISQFDEVGAVSIAGSGNTYFVARKINDVIYKYDRNLSLQELLDASENKPIVMYEPDKNIDAKVVKFDANILYECLQLSTDQTLKPVYYQLSQAEREKLKAGKITIDLAKQCCLDKIVELESEVATSPLNRHQLVSMLNNKNYLIYTAKFNEEIVGFITLQIVDELNIVSVAVKKDYRNLGIATMLINKAEQLSKDKNINSISLEVGYNNVTAYLLYKKLGFTTRRIRKGYYSDGQDCLEMVKNI